MGENSNVNHLKTVIRMEEDTLLRSKNQFEIEKIRMDLQSKRIELQKLERSCKRY